MKDKLTPKVVAVLAMVAVAAVALVGWFGLVSPQRSTASDLDRQIADAKTPARGGYRRARIRAQPAREAAPRPPRSRGACPADRDGGCAPATSARRRSLRRAPRLGHAAGCGRKVRATAPCR